MQRKIKANRSVLGTRPKLTWHSNFLCVKETKPSYSQPEYEVLYWPILSCTLEEAESNKWGKIGTILKYDRNDTYVDDGDTPDIRPRLYRLKDGGETMPIFTQVHIVKPPKIHSSEPVQWREGKWQKLTKANVWVDVEH